MKILKVALKETIHTNVQLDIDFNNDILRSSAAVEDAKRESLLKIKQQMHDKIAVLTLDDLTFTIDPEYPY